MRPTCRRSPARLRRKFDRGATARTDTGPSRRRRGDRRLDAPVIERRSRGVAYSSRAHRRLDVTRTRTTCRCIRDCRRPPFTTSRRWSGTATRCRSTTCSTTSAHTSTCPRTRSRVVTTLDEIPLESARHPGGDRSTSPGAEQGASGGASSNHSWATSTRATGCSSAPTMGGTGEATTYWTGWSYPIADASRRSHRARDRRDRLRWPLCGSGRYGDVRSAQGLAGCRSNDSREPHQSRSSTGTDARSSLRR